MSATSGIVPSKDLVAAFAQALNSNATRFLTIHIQNETLVHGASIPITGSFEEDLNVLQDDSVLKNDFPAYILAKLDESADWIAIFYMPDNAKIRDKMLYASTRASLLKALSSTLFVDSIYATSKADLTPDAYRAHQQHIAAPKPLSSREKELSELRQAETTTADYAGSRARVNHLGTGVGLNWDPEAEQAVKDLAGDDSNLVVLAIDTQTETLLIKSKSQTALSALGSYIPISEPCFALFAWASSDSKREVVFIYSCPTNSPIKHRMIYSSASTSTYQATKILLSNLNPPVSLASRKLETSDPKEVNEAFLISELGGEEGERVPIGNSNKQMFARPKGPGRRR